MSELDTLIEEAKVKVSGVIQRPKMTEKLLGKPPFKFLHDVISAIVQTTGFAEGLYTPEEQDSSTYNEKDAKVNYLQKIFNCVGICMVCYMKIGLLLKLLMLLLLGSTTGSKGA